MVDISALKDGRYSLHNVSQEVGIATSNNAEVHDKDPIKDTWDTLPYQFLTQETSKMQRGDSMMSLGTVHGFETYEPRLLVSWIDCCGWDKDGWFKMDMFFFVLEKLHLYELIRTHCSNDRTESFKGAGELPG